MTLPFAEWLPTATLVRRAKPRTCRRSRRRPWKGYTPVELTGHVNFPRIGQLPYLLTLPGHGFYWFQLCGSEEKQ